MNWLTLKSDNHSEIAKLGIEAEFNGSSLITIIGKGFRVRKSGYDNLVLEVPEMTYTKSCYRCEYKHPKTEEIKVLFQDSSCEDENLIAYGFEQTSTGNWKEHRFNLDGTPAED